MSIKIMNQVWHNAPYRENTLLTLLALADWSDDEGICWPKVSAIAQKVRMTERQTFRIIKQLEQEGMLTVEHHKGRSMGNRYRLNLTKCQDNQKVKPDICDTENLTFATLKPDICDSVIRKNHHEPSVEPSISPASQEGVEVEGFELTSPSKAAKETKTDSDPRWTPFIKALGETCGRVSGEEKVGFAPADFDQLKRFLGQQPNLGIDTFRQWLDNWALSDDINPANKPRNILPSLYRYRLGPLDDHSRPKKKRLLIVPPADSALERHRRQLAGDFTQKGLGGD